MSRVLFDTNIVVRYLHSEAPEHALVKQAVEKLIAQGAELFVTPQVVREFWAVATRPGTANGLDFSIDEAAESVRLLLSQFTLLDDEPGLFSDWLGLVTKHRVHGLPAHDANLAAAARFHGLTHVLTLNERDFKRYALSGLQTLTPADV